MGAEINGAQNSTVATRFVKEIAQIRSTPDQPSVTPASEVSLEDSSQREGELQAINQQTRLKRGFSLLRVSSRPRYWNSKWSFGVLRTSLGVKFNSWSIGDIYFWIINLLPGQIHKTLVQKHQLQHRNLEMTLRSSQSLQNDWFPSVVAIPDKWVQKIHLYQVFRNPHSIFDRSWFRNTS